MRTVFFAIFSLIFVALGCAKVQVQAPKEPIKVDITMRLDVYQHVVRDLDNVDSIVYGPQGGTSATGGGQSMLNFLIGDAYAEDSLSPEVEQAAMRRRDRLNELSSWQAKGVVGENKSGLVEIRDASNADSSVQNLVRDENNDRMVVYRAIAKKNGVSTESIQEIYAKKSQERAPAGTPIEVLDVGSGKYEWKIR
jgi:uncharacterized protein YdbL (DUF1318 family)